MGFLCFLYIQLYPYCSMLAHAHRRNLFENWKTGKINSDCNLSLSFITTHLSLQDLNMPLFMSIQQLQQRIWTIWLNQPVISYTVMDVSWILDCGTHDAGDGKKCHRCRWQLSCMTGWWLGTWILWLSIYRECHHPKWFSYFFRGFKPPTRYGLLGLLMLIVGQPPTRRWWRRDWPR